MLTNSGTPSSAAVRSLLAGQSASLHSIGDRLDAQRAQLTPRAPDGWRGAAERAQAALVANIVSVLDVAQIEVDGALRNTDAAIWSLPDVG